MHVNNHENSSTGHPDTEMIRICEREQETIGRILHDDLGQKLAAAGFMGHALADALCSLNSANAQQASSLCELIKEAQSITRGLARGLHPPKLTANHLGDALENLSLETSAIFQVDCRFTCTCDSTRLFSDETADHLHHIACEAVRNALHHGKASRIILRLDTRAGNAFLSIEDNGSTPTGKNGFSEGLGIQIMRRRAKICGGNIGISNNPGGGTLLVCTIPIQSKHTRRWGLADFIT